MNHFMNNALEWEKKSKMKKSEIVKDLESIKELLEDDVPLMAKERIEFLIHDITNKDKNWHGYQGRSRKQVENNYKVLAIACAGLFITIVGIIIYGLLTT